MNPLTDSNRLVWKRWLASVSMKRRSKRISLFSKKPYGLFCPTSKASEVLEPRWTIQILGELWEGATRFNEIRRGIPNISPSLLSKRLKEMQENGLIERVEDRATGNVEYFRTQMAIDFEPIQHAMAMWAQKHVEADVALSEKDADVLMWTLRKRIEKFSIGLQTQVG